MVAFHFLSTCLLLFSEAGAFTTAPSTRAVPTDGSSSTTSLFLSKPNNSDDWMSSARDQPWSKVGDKGNRNQPVEERRPTMPPPTGERGRRQSPKPGPGIGRKEYVGRAPMKQQQQEKRPNFPPKTAGVGPRQQQQQQQQQQQGKRPNIPQPRRGGPQQRQQEVRKPNNPNSSSTTTTGRGGKQVTYERADVQKWKEEKLRSNNQEMEDFISGAKYNTNGGTGLGRKPVAGGSQRDNLKVEQPPAGGGGSATAGGDGGRFVRYNKQRDGNLILGSEGEKLINRGQQPTTPTNNPSSGNQNQVNNNNSSGGSSSYVDKSTGTRYQRYDKSQKSLYMDSSTDEFLDRVNPPQDGSAPEDPSIAGQQLSSGFTGFSGRDFSQPNYDNNRVQQFEQQQGTSETFQSPGGGGGGGGGFGGQQDPYQYQQQQQQAYYGQDNRESRNQPRDPENPSIFDSIFELLENQLRQLESKDPKSDLRTSREENAKLMAKIDDLKQRTSWKKQEIERLKAQVREEQAETDSTDNGARDNLRISREENAMLKKELESLKARAAWKRKQIDNLKTKLTDERQGGIPSRFDVGGNNNMPEDEYGNTNDPVLNRSKQENKKLKMEIEEMKARTEWKRNEIERLKDKVANENLYNNADNPQFSFDSIDEVRKDLTLSREENEMLKKEAEHLAARAAWKRKEIDRLKAQIARSSGPARTRDLLRLQYLGASMDPVAESPPSRREEEGFLTDFSELDELDSFQRDYEVSGNAPQRPGPPPSMGRPEPMSPPDSRYPGPEAAGDGISGWEAFYGRKREQESKREQLSSGRYQQSSFPRRGGEGTPPNKRNTPPSGAERKPVIPPPPPRGQQPWSNPDRPNSGPADGWDSYAGGPNGEDFDGTMGGGWETFSDDERPSWVEQRANAGRPNPQDAYQPPRQVQRPGADAMFQDWPEYDVKNDNSPDGRKSPGFVGFSDTDYGDQGGNYVSPTKGG